MEHSRFQIGKLLKIFSWVFFIAIPVGMYAMYYSDAQRNYFNERNFRALNELSQQFELHFKALEKLFLFVPLKFNPSYDEKKQKDKSKEQLKHLNALLKELKKTDSQKTDSQGIQWVEDIIYSINLDEQRWHSREIYNRRLHSNDFLNNLKVIEEPKVTQLKTWAEYCTNSSERTLFKLKNSDLTAYPCKDIHEKIKQLEPLEESLNTVRRYIKKIKSSENLEEQQVIYKEIAKEIKTNELLLKKLEYIKTELTEKIEPENIELEKINIIFNKNISYQLEETSRIIKLLKIILNEKAVISEVSKIEFDTLKKLLVRVKNSLTLDINKKIDSVIFNIPLESLLGAQLPSEFDGVLLSNSSGQVLVQKEIKSLQWDEKKTLLKLAGSKTSVSDISWLLKMAKKQIESKNNLSAKSDTDGQDKQQDQEKAIDLGHSTFVDLEVAGTEYRIYIHPFILDYKIYKDQTNNINKDQTKNSSNPKNKGQHFSKFYVLGFVQKNKTAGLIFSLGFINIAFSVLLLIASFLAWPFLRLKFMGIKEAITVNDIRRLLLSLLFGLVILTAFFLTIFTYNGMEERLDKKGQEIAQQIKTAYRNDLDNILDELSNFTEPNNKCQDLEMRWHKGKGNQETNFSCLPENVLNNVVDNKKFTFPLVRDIFTLNNEGKQLGPIIYYVERLFSSMRLKLDFRNYFKKPRDGETWHWQEKEEQDKPFYIERIYNFSDGQKASQVSIPVNDKASDSIASIDPKTAVVRASTTYFPSIAAPVLPASFHFAIIENVNGKILYHSQDEKSFVENLYAESDYNHHLITHGHMRHEGEVEGLYHGRPTKFYISPLKDLPWSVVVYYDIGRLQIFMAKTAIVTLMIYMLYLIPVLFLLVIINKLLVNKWDFLWPHDHKIKQYKQLSFILGALCIGYFFYVLNMSGWRLFVSLIIATFLFLWVIWFFTQNQTRKVPANRRCQKSCHTIFLVCISIASLSLTVIPTAGFFNETFAVNVRNYIRINQLDYAEAMQQRAVKLDQFSRMFYPLKFDKSNNSGSRLLFPENAADTGIFGFNENQLKQQSCEQQTTANNEGPADLFIDFLLKINFQFAQLHVVGNENMENDGWCRKGDTLLFETDDSAGIVKHSITIQKPEMWSVIVEGISKDKTVWWRIPFLLAFSLIVWFFVLNFFSRKVFGIFISEPISQHIPISTQTDININPYKILIRGKYDTYKELLEQGNILFNEEKDVEFLDMLTSNFINPAFALKSKKIFVFDNLDAAVCDVNRRKQALAYLEELVYKSDSYDIYIFIRCQIAPLYRLTNPQAYPYFCETEKLAPHANVDEITRWGKLLAHFDKQYFWAPLQDKMYLDDLDDLSENQINLIKLVKLESSIWPDMDEISKKLELMIREDELGSLNKENVLEAIRQDNLHFRNYCTLYERDKKLASDKLALIKMINLECEIWPELEPIRKELISLILDSHSQLFNKAQVLEYICIHANAYYRNYWELCSRDERLALTQLATGRFINPENKDVIEHLYRRGYIKREPYFQVSNLSFKRYILTAELLENVQNWEKAATGSVWESIKIPLFIVLFSVTGLLVYIASDTFDVTLGLLSGLVAFIPILLKGVNTVRGSSSPG